MTENKDEAVAELTGVKNFLEDSFDHWLSKMEENALDLDISGMEFDLEEMKMDIGKAERMLEDKKEGLKEKLKEV